MSPEPEIIGRKIPLPSIDALASRPRAAPQHARLERPGLRLSDAVHVNSMQKRRGTVTNNLIRPENKRGGIRTRCERILDISADIHASEDQPEITTSPHFLNAPRRNTAL
jgi:hypothetical protein